MPSWAIWAWNFLFQSTRGYQDQIAAALVFQSTRPARGATLESTFCSYGEKFQSTRPARGATDTEAVLGRANSISIHAPREGRDFSPQRLPRNFPHFNPRAPRGARPRPPELPQSRRGISIHAPREGRDHGCCPTSGRSLVFQSTRPMRGATLSLLSYVLTLK